MGLVPEKDNTVDVDFVDVDSGKSNSDTNN